MNHHGAFAVRLPIFALCNDMSYKHLVVVATAHAIPFGRLTRSISGLLSALLSHVCDQCAELVSVFSPLCSAPPVPVSAFGGAATTRSFPPPPLTPLDQASFVRRWAESFSPDSIVEIPCAVCACAVPRRDILIRSTADLDLTPLIRPGAGVTCAERLSSADPHTELPGPILFLDSVFDRAGCESLYVCARCLASLVKGQLPPLVFS